MIYLLPEKKIKNGQVVRVYRNIRKNLFSIQDEKTRRLIAYAESLLLTNVRMKIGQAGQLRVRKERQKNIHAFIVGTFVEQNEDDAIDHKDLKAVYYNPYKTDTFIILETGEPIHEAPRGYLVDGKCYVLLENQEMTI